MEIPVMQRRSTFGGICVSYFFCRRGLNMMEPLESKVHL
jgi:hypothetical protein